MTWIDVVWWEFLKYFKLTQAIYWSLQMIFSIKKRKWLAGWKGCFNISNVLIGMWNEDYINLTKYISWFLWKLPKNSTVLTPCLVCWCRCYKSAKMSFHTFFSVTTPPAGSFFHNPWRGLTLITPSALICYSERVHRAFGANISCERSGTNNQIHVVIDDVVFQRISTS